MNVVPKVHRDIPVGLLLFGTMLRLVGNGEPGQLSSARFLLNFALGTVVQPTFGRLCNLRSRSRGRLARAVSLHQELEGSQDRQQPRVYEYCREEPTMSLRQCCRDSGVVVSVGAARLDPRPFPHAHRVSNGQRFTACGRP